MDFQTTTQVFTQFTPSDTPMLSLDTYNQTEQERSYLPQSDCLWHPYTKYVFFVANFSRLTPAEATSIQLPTAMLETRNWDNNNNFDGVLDADTCSLDSFTNDDSSDMDTFSDVELTDSSDEEIYTAGSVLAQGCGFNANTTPTTTFLPTTSIKIDDESAAEQQTLRDNILINNNIIGTICEESDRPRPRSRGRRDTVEEEFSFKSGKQDKAKPGLPEADLLQGSRLQSGSPVSHHVVHVEEHEEDEDCDCMYAAAASGMYSNQFMQAQDSF